MKRVLRIINCVFIVGIIFILFDCNIVYGADIKKAEYSEKYKEWLELSNDEKTETIAPFPINIRKNNVDNSFMGKIKGVLKSIVIPNSYDLRDHINIEVKNQENTGACWTFTANTSLESYLALHNEIYDFSERHIDYETSTSFTDGANSYALNRVVGSGGFASTAFTYYSRGSGPILEEDMPFENNEISISLFELPRNVAVKKVDNMLYFPNVFKDYDQSGNLIYMDADEVEYSKDEITEIRNQIKEHIMTNGAISVAIYAPDNGVYYNNVTYGAFVNNSDISANHAVTVIGWDDNYSKTNFKIQPKEDGAYLVLNSWGSEWGDDGIYYVSYEDFLIESQMRGVEGISDINYDNLYQHDISEMQNILEYKYGANVFTSKNDENLTEILIGSLSDQVCNVYVNTEDDNLNIQGLTKVANNVKLRPGYNTVTLSNPLHIEAGNKFAIVVEITSEDEVGIGIEDNSAWFGNATSKSSESFVSENGIDWQDIYNKNNMMNLSIKAYTQTDEKYFNVSNISGKAITNLGGKLSFNIKTSYIYSQEEIEINIINSLEENITERFVIEGNEIRGNGAFVKIHCPYDIEQGQYEVLITELNSNNTISKTFSVDANNGEYITAKFNDEIFWGYVTGEMSNAITDSVNLTISAKPAEFNKIRNISTTWGKGITDITGIEYLTNLESINLNNNEITDLTPLSNLQHLTSLYIGLNDCVDFSPLSNLSSLKELHISGNDLSNGISFLQNLTNLENLRMHAAIVPNEIDISYIFNLHKLKYLDLTLWRWITEDHLQGISNLTNLESLIISSCNIGSIDFVEGLHLRTLEIGNATKPAGSNHITDLSPIRDMTSLVVLDLSRLNGIETLNDIANLSNLDAFWCQECHLRDATALDGDGFKDKTSWSNLWLSYNSIRDDIVRRGSEMIIEVPKIIQQASDEDSLLYSSSGLTLYNCEWEEYGKSIRVNSNTNYFYITVRSGYTANTRYDGYLVDCKPGDLNRSGKIDLSDIIIALKAYLDIEPLADEDLTIADMDKDGNFTLTDIIVLLKKYLGLI